MYFFFNENEIFIQLWRKEKFFLGREKKKITHISETSIGITLSGNQIIKLSKQLFNYPLPHKYS